MLNSLRRKLIRTVVPLAVLGTSIAPAVADDGSGSVNPCAVHDICVVITDPGSGPNPGSTSPGRGSGDPKAAKCYWNNRELPCWDDDLGWFREKNGCYYRLSFPQPPAEEWPGHDTSKGSFYDPNCRLGGPATTAKDPEWWAAPPSGPPAADDLGALALQAIGKLGLGITSLHSDPSGTAVVGAPLWLSYGMANGRTSPDPAVVSGRWTTVTAAATFKSVTWDTGDGRSATCTTPGARHDTDPTGTPCTYSYRTSSARQPQQSYYLTATVTWHITARLADGTDLVVPFDFPVSSDGVLPLKVAEVQVLNN